ncbi:hypothetical protein Tco_0579691 [Tanacetum coccineum]
MRICEIRVVNEIDTSAPRKNKEWQDKLSIVLKAEEIIYSKASTKLGFTSAVSGWGSYGSDVASNSVWAKQCENFFRRSGSIASEGECSSRPFGKQQRRLRLGSSIAHTLSDEVGTPADLGKKRRKQTKSNGLRVKKMRISDGSSFRQNIGSRSLTITDIQSPGNISSSAKGLMYSENYKFRTSSVIECVSGIQIQPGFTSAFNGCGPYGSDVAVSSVWSNQCENFFRQSGSIASQDVIEFKWQSA